MKTAPLTPRQAPLKADATHAQRLLAASNLPARWRDRQRFVVLQLGFGSASHFLAIWQAWRSDPRRCRHLYVLALEPHPPTQQALRQGLAASATPDLAQALVDAWPELTPNVHALDFEGGQVQLLLAFGDAGTLLPALRAQVDAFQLIDPTHDDNARCFKALARLAAADATLAGTGMHPALHKGLATSGFVLQAAPDDTTLTTARFAPRSTVRARPAAASCCPAEAIVIGAGIAGAAVAQAMARNGLAVRVFDRHDTPAQGASGNPAGLFHGTVHAGDGVHARLFRAAALHAQRSHAQALQDGVPGSTAGLLRLGAELPTMQALLQALRMPSGYVQALNATDASRQAGVPLLSPAWLYPGGGWIAPADLIAHQLRQPGITFIGSMAVARVSCVGSAQGRIWRLHDAQDRVLAQTPLLVLANAADAMQLLQALGHAVWPLQQIRGQVTWWTAAHGQGSLRVPLAGDGYAIPLPGGGLLSGATREAVEPSASATALRPDEQLLNVQGFEQLTSLQAPTPAQWHGRVGWRLQADDRLPLAGPVPLARMAHGQRLDQARLLPRESGLFVLTALGARGLTLAPLLARLVAAQATGAPWPLEQDLADAVDPGRWVVRAARHAV